MQLIKTLRHCLTGALHAAVLLHLPSVPTVVLSNLSPAVKTTGLCPLERGVDCYKLAADRDSETTGTAGNRCDIMFRAAFADFTNLNMKYLFKLAVVELDKLGIK